MGDVLLIYEDGSALFVSADCGTVKGLSISEGVRLVPLSDEDLVQLLRCDAGDVRMQVIAMLRQLVEKVGLYIP